MCPTSWNDGGRGGREHPIDKVNAPTLMMAMAMATAAAMAIATAMSIIMMTTTETTTVITIDSSPLLRRPWDKGDLSELAAMPADVHQFLQTVNYLFLRKPAGCLTTFFAAFALLLFGQQRTFFVGGSAKTLGGGKQGDDGDGIALLVAHGCMGAARHRMHHL